MSALVVRVWHQDPVVATWAQESTPVEWGGGSFQRREGMSGRHCGEGVRGKRDVRVVSSYWSKRKPRRAQLAQGLKVKVMCRRQQRGSSGQDPAEEGILRNHHS